MYRYVSNLYRKLNQKFFLELEKFQKFIKKEPYFRILKETFIFIKKLNSIGYNNSFCQNQFYYKKCFLIYPENN